MPQQPDEALVANAVATAERWQHRANALLTDQERAVQEQLRRLLTHPRDKLVLTRLIDQSFRSCDPRRVADQVHTLLKTHGVPEFFSTGDKLLVRMFMGLGRHLPSVSVPKLIDKMRQDSGRMVVDGEDDALHAYLRRRQDDGLRVNVNRLGEAVLGEAEAARRLATYLADLRDPQIEVISVKISTLYSQISSLALEHTVAVLVERLGALYREARSHRYARPDGTRVPKLVCLDMEAYRDLAITCAAFVQTLDQPEFKQIMAGIALQAYLPESYALQQRLTAWARQRVADGGGPILLRIVKGANLEMELLESAHFDWPLAPFDTKLAVDANYKRMLRFGLAPENAPAAHLGIASHNLFELAYAFELGRANQVEKYFHFEMLEGMADHVRRALGEASQEVLLYAPVARREEFINAVAYLMRRLDENTAEANYLRHAPHLEVDSAAWRFLQGQFIASCDLLEQAEPQPHRIQNRGTEVFEAQSGTYFEAAFTNEPDTDWSLAANRQWAQAIRDRWRKPAGDPAHSIPLVVAGREIYDDREQRLCVDPSQRPLNVTTAVYRLATRQDIEAAVAAATSDPDGWRALSMDQRHRALSRVALELRKARGDLIGAAAADTGKLFTEADVEVSEAVDFAEYYPFAARAFAGSHNLEVRGKGVGAVISPWNFPIAIPCGGIVAALAAGNTVLFKPASDAVRTAWVLCQCFWRAGISRHVLQFVPCAGESVGAHLVTHAGVDFVILTGGTATGLAMLRQKPGMQLSAETGGKNATIVTALADRDQAIKHVVHSAFGHAGQKCSATSLLILETEVYDDPHFKRQLVDAAQSFKAGSAWDFSSRMGPLIRPPEGDLLRALTRLEPLESWALQPRSIDDNPHLWTPGIKYGVQSGSFTHMTELFGPLLAVMRADDLAHAIELVHQTGYGLTSGLESLDAREQQYWKAHLRAGNLYLNRGTTGAVTLRQPFGGMGKSALGPAIKAGGPNYVTQFMEVKEIGPPRIDAIKEENALLRWAMALRRKLMGGQLAPYAQDLSRLIRAIQSYCYQWEQEFGVEKDYFHLRGQDNLHRYLPLGAVGIRLHPQDSLFDLLARIAAARVTGNTTVVSIPKDMHNTVTDFMDGQAARDLLGPSSVRRQSDEKLIAAFDTLQRIRYAAPDRVPAEVLQNAAQRGYYIARAPVLMEGRLELLHYVQNQSVCDNYHRYGNLGERAGL
jgi:RHH-type proline utilization regulon transcriptional repressor/proline dehydrogenase/delta 1-pyrroline-5-carboxylate dehydrogenase